MVYNSTSTHINDDGGSVTQATSLTTDVIINGTTGQIVTFAAAVALGTTSSFFVQNNRIGLGSKVYVGYRSNVLTVDRLPLIVSNITLAGGANTLPGFSISIHNATGSNSNATSKTLFFIIDNPVRSGYIRTLTNA